VCVTCMHVCTWATYMHWSYIWQETRAKIKKCGRRILADMQKIKASKDAAKQAAYDMQVSILTHIYMCVCIRIYTYMYIYIYIHRYVLSVQGILLPVCTP
jgi:hypothetical protein